MKKHAELSSTYRPEEHEVATYTRWEEAGVFAPTVPKESSKPPFVVMLPPPNITGSLHMGHALQDTIMDILVRWHRMMGDPTLWVPGTDHAAIATNKVIESQLHAEGKTRHDIGRQAFLDRTAAWYAETGAVILTQMRRLGCSCDWSRHRFTLDEGYVRAVTEAFIRYYQRGYIYRGARIVNWDPKTQTTVSDLEIDWHTERTALYTLKYGPFEIGTARPETKFGDKYVVVHPEDTRYAQYQHGQTLSVEWINGPITATVIKDASVDMRFGTGAMTITPWHDETDFAIAERHHLDMEHIIGFDGRLLPIAGEFAGLSIEEARPKIVAKLADKGLLVSVTENYEHNVALNDRGKGVIEPQVMRQWFVDMSKLKADTIKVAAEEKVRFVPPRWKEHFLAWMNNVHDWNINRQIWLGHRLPVWWRPDTHGTDNEEGNFVVSPEQPASGDWEQDPDTLDTWFSSALWPFATLGWPDQTADLTTFYPTSVLVTAREIVYLWVARMIFSGLELLKDTPYERPTLADRIPFKEVFIHPVVLAKNGQRMSKSLGTGIDPLELIDAYGADATRFGLIAQMNYDMQQMKFDEAAIKGARNFANKIWNIARLLQTLPDREETTVADTWITGRAEGLTRDVTQLLTEYKVGEAARLLHAFVWSDFADWYLEILKTAGSTAQAQAVFTRVLQLLHPFMPHLTEVLWSHFGDSSLLIIHAWPTAVAEEPSEGITRAMEAMAYFKEVTTAVRTARSLLTIKPASQVQVHTPQPPVLPATFEAMTRSQLIDTPADAMKYFPLPSGGTIGIGSPEITPQSIERAQGKLQQERTRVTAILAQQERVLKSMQGKAEITRIEEREATCRRLQAQLQEIDRSLAILG